MDLRPTQATSYDNVRRGLYLNFVKLMRAQEQVSSGKRILRPSDDPVGTSSSLALSRQIGEVGRYRSAVGSAQPLIDAGIAAIDEAGTLYSEARELLMQGLNGTLNADDRRSIGQQIELLKARLVEIGNSKLGEHYLFSGTHSGSSPFVETSGPAGRRVVYEGDGATRAVAIGAGVSVPVNISGDQIFGQSVSEGTVYGGLTGLSAGTTADEGSGYRYITVRHVATSGTFPAGITSAGAGANDSFVGDRTLVVDATARTVRLGSGPPKAIPGAGSSELADLRVLDEHGAEIHLDLSGWTGLDANSTVSGSASISFDGSTFTALTLGETDLELTDARDGTTVHVDATGLRRAGTDLVTFSGTVNAFDALQGIADDLANAQNLDPAALQQRLSARIGELDRNFDNLQISQGTLGARSQRLTATESRLGDFDVSLQALRSDIEDADLTDVILDMSRAEQTLQLAQATGARLLQNTLLNYLQ